MLRIRNYATATALAGLIATGSLAAQDALTPADAAPFLGEWTLSAEIQGNPVDMNLSLVEEGGAVKGTLVVPNSPRGPEPQEITNITKDGEGIKLSWDVDFGGQSMALHLALQRDGDGVSGDFGDEGGFFSSEISGTMAGGSGATTPTAGVPSFFLGDWTLAADIQGNRVQFQLSVMEEGGKPKASLVSPQSPEPSEITDITTEGDQLKLAWAVDFGGQSMALHMELAQDGDGLAGSFADDNGFFSAELTGTRVGGGPQVASDEGEEAIAAAEAADSGRRPRGRRRRAAPTPTLDLGNGKQVRLAFDPEDATAPAADLEKLGDGDVLQLVESRVIKLLTDKTLRFGDVEIAQGNMAPNYPGVYGLWVQRKGDGWNLVFNNQADVWGTMHDPAHDIASVPLVHETADTPSEKLDVQVAGVSTSGQITIQVGAHRFLASFDVVQ